MSSDIDASRFFNGFASTFDTLYDGKRSKIMQLVDRRFRSDMFLRFAMTFEVMGNLTEKTVLDVGCGSGPYVVEALRRGASHVTALDPAPNMLELTRSRLEQAGVSSKCSLVQGLFPATNLRQHDHAIVMGVMDYVADRVSFLRALLPLVQESAVLSFSSRHWFRTPLRKMRYKIRRCPVYFYDEKQIQSLARAAGFRDITINKIPGAGMDYHVCLKP